MKKILFLPVFLFFITLSALLFSTETKSVYELRMEQATHAIEVTFHVSPQGNDTWTGTRATPNEQGTDGPFRSLTKAQTAVRSLLKTQKTFTKPIIVAIQNGVYETLQPLTFGPEDSGNDSFPVIWKAADRAEVRLVGGKFLNGFTPVTDQIILDQIDSKVRDKIVQCDLAAIGIHDTGSAGGGGAELFFENRPMRLSRYPNSDFMTISELITEGTTEINVRGIKGIQQGFFRCDDPRISRWKNEKDPWTYGYWYWDWAANAQRIDSIDVANKTIRLAKPWHNYGYRKNQWFYAYNLLCELDEPGEYYIDREKGILYFYPPAPIKNNSTLISLSSSLWLMKQTSNVIVRGITFEACRANAVEVHGQGILITQCTIRNTGGMGILVQGENHTVFGCHLYQIGTAGIYAEGGNRKTLQKSGISIVNNDIHNYARIQRIYAPGINISGVAIHVTNNRITDAPHMGMGFSGNDHLMELNEISNVCYESNDAGAIYTGRNWTMRGNVLRYNYLHDIRGFRNHGCVGIYLDDMFSSAEINGNLFINVTSAAFIGGGRDNHILNNIFIDCKPAIHIDARALGWSFECADRWINEATTQGTISGIAWKEPPYSVKYPKLLSILEGQPKAPEGNVVERNICVGEYWDSNKKGPWKGDSVEGKALPFVEFKDNFVGDPHFVDPKSGDYRLKPDSPAAKIGFVPIPVKQMGIYPHPLAVDRNKK